MSIKGFKKLFALSPGLLIASGFAAAQLAHDGIPARLPKLAEPLPFKAGETLSYEVNFSKFIFSGSIGELKLSVADSDKPELIELRAEAVSKGFFPALFGVKVRDRYSSRVSRTDFGLLTSTKSLEEGKNRREQKTIVDREAGRVAYSDRDLARPTAAPTVREKSSPSWVQDLLSTIYFVRTQPLKDGDVIPVAISDAAAVYNIEVVVMKREEVKTTAGRFKAIQLNAKVFDERYIKRSGEMLVWVSDDDRRIPLRARVKFSGSTVSVELKRLPNI